MTQTRFGEQACHRVREKLDSYIDNELLTESNLELAGHLQRCTSCARETQERQDTRARLRAAVRQAPVPAGLEERVRDRLRQKEKPQTWKFHLMAIAAALMVCIGSWAVYQRGAPRESHIETLTGQVAAIMRVGLGDHLHCAVIRQHANRSKGPVDNLPARFKELIPIVQERGPANLPLTLAHECRYHGRRFVHLTFRNESNLLSLVIAHKQDGESLRAGDVLPTLSESGIPIYEAGVRQYQAAAFESRDFLVYTVSDLHRRSNRDVLAALAPSLRNFLNQMGA